MTSGRPGPKLAEAAAPMRRWLTGYFRRRVQSDADAEDLVQDVFARISARDSEEPIGHLGGYIVRTAASVLADWGRRRTSRGGGAHIPFDAELHGEEEFDPARILEGKQDLHVATTALLRLPERTRTVFILRRLEGWSYKEIASHVGVSVSAVEKHMVRAIHCLSLELEDPNAS